MSNDRFLDLNSGRLSPIHWSSKNGVHADLTGPGVPGGKAHVPYYGQTTLDMFPGAESSRSLSDQLRRINDHGLGGFRG
ncbi:MAG: hypothetical protein IT436_18835 [Phycisphaerales bacterium]|nr:hypothetical protein [Phycisphaerales bacterium]